MLFVSMLGDASSGACVSAAAVEEMTDVLAPVVVPVMPALDVLQSVATLQHFVRTMTSTIMNVTATIMDILAKFVKRSC